MYKTYWRLLSLILLLNFNFANAEITLSSEEIKNTLDNATAIYQDNARQFFADDGRTDYVDHKGNSSIGKWFISDNKYCSSWGPNTRTPTCYTVTRHDDGDAMPIIRWDGEYEAVIHNGNLLAP